MNKSVRLFLLVASISFLPLLSRAQGYDIQCTISALKNQSVILGHYYGSEKHLMVDDTLQLNAQGMGRLTGEKPLPQGMYFFYIPGKSKFDFVLGEDQQFSLSNDTTDFLRHARFTGSPENDIFYAYNRYNQEKYLQYRSLSDSFAKATDAEKTQIRNRIMQLTTQKNQYIDSLSHLIPQSYIATLLEAVSEPQIPDAPLGVAAQEYKAQWMHDHFFDSFNLTDSSLLRTPFYEDRLISYLSQYVVSHPDSLILESDRILKKVQFSPTLFRFTLITFWNHFVTSKLMGMDAVWVHLAQTWYLPYGTWLTPNEKNNIRTEVDKKKSSLIGMPAPPLEMLMALPVDHFKLAQTDTTTRYDLHAGVMQKDFRETTQSDFTVLLFWDITCSHCKETIVKLHEAYQKLKTYNVSVITVQVLLSRDGKSKWIDYVNEHQFYDWMNAWSPYSAEYKQLYDATVVPIIYVLDKQKIIIAKQLSPEQIEGFIQFTLSQQK